MCRDFSMRQAGREQSRGFTLIEMMIVVVIIGVLASIAVPAYQNYVTRGKIAEATTNLADLRVKMEQYYMDNRTYLGTSAPCTPIPAGSAKYFTYSCPEQSASSYTIEASGIVADSAIAGFRFRIDSNNVRSTPAVPSAGGWVASANCWVTRPGAAC